MPPGHPAARLAVLGLIVALSLGHLAVLNPSPLAGEPRPQLTNLPTTERWIPPLPVTSEAFATFPVAGPRGEQGLWLLRSDRVPIRFQAEREVVDRFGLDELEEAVEVFNDVPGTRFGAEVADIVDDDVNERRRDGVNRIFLDRQTCGERFLARAHLWSDPTRVQDGRAVRYVNEVDIGLCDRLDESRLATVVRHELAHIAGLDHLCDPDEDCHRRGMSEDNTCRIMSPRLHECQELEDGDLDGLVHIHPRLPRAGTGDGRAASARAVRATHPAPRSAMQAVISDADAPLSRRLLSATLAGHLGAPHILVDDDCTTGSDGQALNHSLAVTGSVIAVGGLPGPCQQALEGSWQIDLEVLHDTTELIEAMAEAAGGAPTRLVLAPHAPDSGSFPLAATAAPLAVALDAPLVMLGEGGQQDLLAETLEAHPTIAEVVVVGSGSQISTRDLDPVTEAGVSHRRLPAVEAIDGAVRVAESADLDGQRPLSAAVVAEHRPDHAPAAISLASATSGVLVPVANEPGGDELDLLADHVTRGTIVGGTQTISTDLQRQLSRAVDGDA